MKLGVIKTVFFCSCLSIASTIYADEDVVETFSVMMPDIALIRQNEFALRDEGGELIVLGTEGSWGNDPSTTKRAAFDGDVSTFFDPTTQDVENGGCWAGLSFAEKRYVAKIRYKGRKDNYKAFLRMNGVRFEGADNPDFTNATLIATADLQKDRPSGETRAWDGTNYWMEISVPVEYSKTNAFSQSVANRKGFKYLRAIAPNQYARGMQDQSGTCGGNISELEFYGFNPAMSSNDATLSDEACRPKLISQRMSEGVLYTEIELNFPQNELTNEDDRLMFGFDVFREIPHGGTYKREVFDGGFIPGSPEPTNYVLSDTKLIPGARYVFKLFNNVAQSEELVFYVPELLIHPKNVRVVSSDNQTGVPRLEWVNDSDSELANGIHIYRATSPGGPWTLLNTSSPLPVEQVAYEDTTSNVGILYYYCLKYVFADETSDEENAFYEGKASKTVSYTKVVNLERVWNGSTSTLKEGMKAICHYKPWNANDSDWNNFATMTGDGYPINLFDGNVNTFSDIQPKGDNKQRDKGDCKAGVDLGKAYVITRARIHPRVSNDSTERSRFGKLALFASNADATSDDDGWRDDNNVTKITDVFSTPNPYNSYYEVKVNDQTPYRYVFVKHAIFPVEKDKEAFANAAELELYGYDAASNQSLVIAPLQVSEKTYTASNPSPSGKIGVEFSWSEGQNASHYCVEMFNDEIAAWELIEEGATNITQTSYFWETDSSNVESLRFRIVAVGEATEDGNAEVGYSKDIIQQSNIGGTGLYGVYTHPYETDINQSKEWIRRVDSQINFRWGQSPIIPEAPTSTNDVLITWSGYLVAPVEGLYSFSSYSDGGFALRIDDNQVINNWAGNTSGEDTGELYLTAGQHKIRVDYQTSSTKRNRFCQLQWGGAVEDNVIPMDFLIPEPLPAMSYPWLGERTFNSIVKGYADFTRETDPKDPTKQIDNFVLYASGGDMWNEESTFHSVWRIVTGDFSITALLERKINVVPDETNDKGWAWKALLLARKGLDSDAPLIGASYSSNGIEGRADLKIRAGRGLSIADEGARKTGLSSQIYQKLERKGNVFTQSFSNDGENWEVVKEWTDENGVFSGTLYVGPAMSSIAGLRQLGSYKFSVMRVSSSSGSSIVYIR